MSEIDNEVQSAERLVAELRLKQQKSIEALPADFNTRRLQRKRKPGEPVDYTRAPQASDLDPEYAGKWAAFWFTPQP